LNCSNCFVLLQSPNSEEEWFSYCSSSCSTTHQPVRDLFGTSLDHIREVGEKFECDEYLLFSTLLILCQVRLEEEEEGKEGKEGGGGGRISPLDPSLPNTALFRSTKEDVATLVSHLDQAPYRWKESVKGSLEELLALTKLEGGDEGGMVERGMEVAGIINANAHSLPSSPLFGLYPLSSLLNHSCDPNSFFMPEGEMLVVRAVRRIECGEEVTISYTPLYQSRCIRRRELRDNRFFKCECSRCKHWENEKEITGIRFFLIEVLNAIEFHCDFFFENFYMRFT